MNLRFTMSTLEKIKLTVISSTIFSLEKGGGGEKGHCNAYI